GGRLATQSDKDLVGSEFQRLAVFRFDDELALLHAFRFGAEMNGDAVLLQPFADGFDKLGVIEGQDAIQRFHHRYFGTEFAEGDAEFEADIACAHHDETFWDFAERQSFGGRNHIAAERQEREFDGHGTGGEDDVFGGDGGFTIFGFDVAGLAVAERAPAMHHAHLRALEQRGDAAVQLIDDGFLPLHGFGEIDGGLRRQRNAVTRLGHRFKVAGDVDDGFRWNAAANEAGAAQTIRFDQRGVEAELSGADRGDVASGAAAQHKHLGVDCLSHSQSMNKVAGCSSIAFTRWMNSAASKPSTTRWSKDEERFIILRTTIWPFFTTGRSTIALGPMIATSG